MRVVVVDDETVGVTHRPMPVRMTVRFVPGWRVVVVVVVGPVAVHVVVDELGVGMGKDLGVVLRPEPGSECREDQDAQPERERRDRHPEVGAEQAGHRIEDEPARVRQGELRREVRGAVHPAAFLLATTSSAGREARAPPRIDEVATSPYFAWMRSVLSLTLAALLACPVQADEVRPGVLRTPESRFENLEDFPYAPNYLQVGDIRLHYVDEGPRDGQTLLLIHGEPTWSYLFRKMIPVFTDAGYRVVAPDLVGFGRSDKFVDEEAYSYPMQVEYMQALVGALDLSDVTFFGQDWGGLIGLRVVAAEPERFARVVVSNTGLPAADGVQGWVGYTMFKLAVWWEGALTLEELQAEVTFPRWVAYSYHVEDLPIGRLMSFMGANERVVSAYEAPFPDRSYKAAAQIMPYLVPSQLRENEAAWAVFENWNKPFLVAFTDSDPITRGGEAAFLSRVAVAQNVTIRGAGHFVQEDAGRALAELMVDFMAGRELPAEILADSPVPDEAGSPDG